MTAAMDQAVLAAFDDAQRRGLALLKDVLDQLSEGMTEVELADAARDLAPNRGFSKWFHPPEVLFGERTASNAVWKTPSAKSRLRRGELVTVLLGPSDSEAYADVGLTRVFDLAEAASPPPVLSVAREAVRATAGFASQWKTVGELYIYARAWAVNHRMDLVHERSIGHAILPRDGLLAAGFPMSAHSTTWLRRYQVHRLNPNRVSGMWALRPQIADGKAAAQFAEIIYVDGPDKRILGRDDISEVGTV